MGKRHDTLQLFLEGLSPTEIAGEMGVLLNTTLPYLNEWVGKGRIRRSDIYFSISPDVREIVQREREGFEGLDWQFRELLSQKYGPSVAEDSRVVDGYGDARTAYGDMYQDLREVELRLHHLVREALSGSVRSATGQDWWTKYVPIEVREKCANRRTADGNSTNDLFAYVDILDLRKIVAENWNIFERAFSSTDSPVQKHEMLFDLKRLNEIRRVVMHPVRGPVPAESDFDFVRGLKNTLGHD